MIAPDLRGFGDAPKPATVEAYQVSTVAQDMIAILDALHVAKTNIVGHDWGAAVARVLAGYYPQRVERLVLLGVGCPGTSGLRTIEQRERFWFFPFFQFEGIAEEWLQHDKWCIPSVIVAKFVWRLEDILDLYAKPHQSAFLVICFDEAPYQMMSETSCRCQCGMENQGVMILSIDEKILVTCSCFCGPWQVGGMSKSPISEPNSISPDVCRIWLKFIFRKPKRSGWWTFAKRTTITSIPIPQRPMIRRLVAQASLKEL